MKKNIAVIAGGFSSEKIVSIKSAETILNHLPKDKYNVFLAIIDEKKWVIKTADEEILIDKNDFSFVKDNEKITIDCAYITIHGTPGEDGKIQGYFDLVNIPYSTCNQNVSSLTFNKWFNNQVLLNNEINCAKSTILRDKSQAFIPEEIIDKLGLPCFVKPNDGGSSFGISKVKHLDELIPAINNAFSEGKEVVIESFISGREVTCGAYKINDEVFTLPLTEIVSHNDYFDFEAKYKGLSDEITPAPIANHLTEEVKALTVEIYELLGLSGIIRVDYMLKDDITPYVIEVNTTPGMSAQSLIPQQVAIQEGIDLATLLDQIIEEAIKNSTSN